MTDVMAGVRAEYAAAIRAVNAAFYAIPEPYRPEAATIDDLHREVDAAFAARDRARAVAAIAAWRRHWLERFTRSLLNAPLEEPEGAGRG